MLGELANKMDWLTGGADGLQGVVMGPILGRFTFDLGGRVGYVYSLVVCAMLFYVSRKLVHAPFGYALKAIRDNRLRATAIGIHVNARLAVVFTISAGCAGVAGALVAQTTGFASLDLFDFNRSADVLLVLVIGGTGYLYGGIIGAVVFKLMYDVLSAWTPQYWQFWMGLTLVVVVLIGHERLTRPFAIAYGYLAGRRVAAVDVVGNEP
jgi:branched-chain amino acid transport system permease protein